MAKPLEEWTPEELRGEIARLTEELARRSVSAVKKPKVDIVRACEHWVRGFAWDETFTREMVEDEFSVHERKIGRTLSHADRERLIQLWLALRDERALAA